MRKKNFTRKIKHGVGALLALITLGFSPILTAQTQKPKQLRHEVLQSKAKEDAKVKAMRKKTFGNAPPAGAMVLKPANPSTANRGSTLIKMEKAYEMLYDEFRMPGIQILKGSVRFRQDNSLLYCDSAYFNQEANSFNAFNNVRIVQGDTLTIYGDYLYYDGNTRMAQVWDNVKLVNRNTVLTTNTLYYDRNIDLAYYNTGGHIEDGNNVLTSTWGQYSPATKTALFKDQVKMTNPDSQMTTDTLKYNTGNSVADIVGNSLIIHKNETDIYSQRGWYDTKNDRMMLLDRSLVEQTDGKTLVGDTIFYDKKSKYGEAFSNVELNDPKNKSTLTGNYVSYNEATSEGLATDSALFVDWSSKDSLHLSADTLYTYKDSVATDSVAYNGLKAFKNVRFLRNDIQGMCDSLLYTSRDSIIHMRIMPVLWADNNQLSGKEISAFTKNQKVNKVVVKRSGIAIQHDSLNYYNQLAGKELIAHLDSNQLKQVNVNGNVETIYYPKDEKTKKYVGVNKTLSSYAVMYFKDKKIDRIVLTTASSGTMYPISQMEEDDLFLRNFYWYEVERPQKVSDVFSRFERVEPPKRAESKKRPEFPGSSDGDDDNEPTERSNTRNNNTNNRAGTNNNNMNSSPALQRRATGF